MSCHTYCADMALLIPPLQEVRTIYASGGQQCRAVHDTCTAASHALIPLLHMNGKLVHVCVPVCSVAQFTTDDIGLIWLTSSNQTTAALTYLRTLASNTSYGILGESSTLHHQYHYRTFWLLPAVSADVGRSMTQLVNG